MTYKYEGSSGKKYQYDLSIPSDKEAYNRDMNAQRRDEMNLDVGGDIARDKRYNPNLAGVKEE
jgi:hypothetical protein